ncbi:MAG: hypothetical protein AAFP69_01765 [Planctomycetota bacterium]
MRLDFTETRGGIERGSHWWADRVAFDGGIDDYLTDPDTATGARDWVLREGETVSLRLPRLNDRSAWRIQSHANDIAYDVDHPETARQRMTSAVAWEFIDSSAPSVPRLRVAPVFARELPTTPPVNVDGQLAAHALPVDVLHHLRDSGDPHEYQIQAADLSQIWLRDHVYFLRAAGEPTGASVTPIEGPIANRNAEHQQWISAPADLAGVDTVRITALQDTYIDRLTVYHMPITTPPQRRIDCDNVRRCVGLPSTSHAAVMPTDIGTDGSNMQFTRAAIVDRCETQTVASSEDRLQALTPPAPGVADWPGTWLYTARDEYAYSHSVRLDTGETINETPPPDNVELTDSEFVYTPPTFAPTGGERGKPAVRLDVTTTVADRDDDETTIDIIAELSIAAFGPNASIDNGDHITTGVIVDRDTTGWGPTAAAEPPPPNRPPPPQTHTETAQIPGPGGFGTITVQRHYNYTGNTTETMERIDSPFVDSPTLDTDHAPVRTNAVYRWSVPVANFDDDAPPFALFGADADITLMGDASGALPPGDDHTLHVHQGYAFDSQWIEHPPHANDITQRPRWELLRVLTTPTQPFNVRDLNLSLRGFASVPGDAPPPNDNN